MENYIKICPKCGSTNIGSGYYNSAPHDFCKDCGFGDIKTDSIAFTNFPEVKISEIENFRRELKKNK